MSELEFDTLGNLHGVLPIPRMRTRTNGGREFLRKPAQERRPTTDRQVGFRLEHLTTTERCWLEQDLERAARLQRQLLPEEHTRIEGWEISYCYQALGPVGGDYCDIMKRGGDKEVLVVFGDASGKGIAASLLMAQLHVIFRSLGSADLSLEEVVERANRILCQHAAGVSYATVVCMRATSEGEIEICNAGHCPPLFICQVPSGFSPMHAAP
jgi:serine phosphatase RsbU (regulator of sigma subunit)